MLGLVPVTATSSIATGKDLCPKSETRDYVYQPPINYKAPVC